MVALVAIGFAAGLVTGLSPCVLPVLPILLAGGASGGRRRPYAIVAGIVVSFTVFTLTAVALLNALGLPEDVLRDVAIVLLFVAAAALIVPRLGLLMERPLARLARRPAGDLGGGFVLGAATGLVFVPCAGPVLGAVSVLAASRDFGVQTFALTGAYALGHALPMLAVALGGRRFVRGSARRLRPALGLVMAAATLAIALDWTRPLQTFVPGYTAALQDRIERSAVADRELARLTGARADESAAPADLGPAPELAGINGWINSRPLSLRSLRGRVVLIDFWTYSCINCLRTLPYLRAWDEAYRDSGLTVVGVHTPEFAFERDADNVRRAVRQLRIDYPVALDNEYATWNAFANRYWPAKYFIDRRGRLRFVHYGEGEYQRSEQVLRELLAEDGTPPRDAADTPRERTRRAAITPESYLGWGRLARYVGSPIVRDEPGIYHYPAGAIPAGHLAYEGLWVVQEERIIAGLGARLRLSFHARVVHLVLAGEGRVEVLLGGRRRATVAVDEPRLYTLLRLGRLQDGLLELRFSPGVAAYAFTFGA